MKPWQLNKRVNSLSTRLADSIKTETTIDWNCLSEPERQLLTKVDEIIKQYAPAQPPEDVIEKNADLWYKGLEILGRRAMELFVEIMPASLCCDELEAWFFKFDFHDFWRRWIECQKNLKKWSKKDREDFLRDIKIEPKYNKKQNEEAKSDGEENNN